MQRSRTHKFCFFATPKTLWGWRVCRGGCPTFAIRAEWTTTAATDNDDDLTTTKANTNGDNQLRKSVREIQSDEVDRYIGKPTTKKTNFIRRVSVETTDLEVVEEQHATKQRGVIDLDVLPLMELVEAYDESNMEEIRRRIASVLTKDEDRRISL